MRTRLVEWGDFWLCGFKWWRARRGGHWELWYHGPPQATLWHRMAACSRVTGERLAMIGCRDKCEDHDLSILEQIAKASQ